MTVVEERSARALLSERTFRRYWSAAAVSLVGDQVSLLAVPLLAVLMLHASPAEMGYLTAAGLVPNLFFSLYAGVWIDRRRHRRHIMIAADLGRALFVASIPIAYAFHHLSLTQLYVVAFLIGTLSTVFELANQTLFVAIVPAGSYVKASSLLNGARAMSFVVGPSLGGLLVQLLTAPIALIIDGVSFGLSGLFLRTIAPAEPPAETERKGQVAAGFRWLRDSRAVSTLLLAVATVNLFNFMFAALVILYVTTYLGITPGVIGLILGAASVGGLIGSVITGRLARAIGVGPSYLVGLIAFPAPLLLIPAADGPRPVVLALLFLAEFGSGLGVMILDIAAGAIMAALVPNRLRARVAGAYRMVNYGIRPVGALLGGVVGSAIGVRPTLWLCTSGALLGGLWLIGSPILKLRELPEPADLPEPTLVAEPTEVPEPTGSLGTS
jgi:MFS family permease